MQNTNVSATNGMAAGWAHSLESVASALRNLAAAVGFAGRIGDAMKATPAAMPHCDMRSEVSVRVIFEAAGR